MAGRMIDAVICSIDEAKFHAAARNLRGRLASLGLAGITRISDARAMGEGLNRGAEEGDSEWILFCHDDIEILHIEPDTFREALATLDMFGVAGSKRLVSANWYDADADKHAGSIFVPGCTNVELPNGSLERDPNRWDHQVFGRGGPIVRSIVALDGCFIACRRSTWEAVRFDDEMPGFTCYDVDFTWRAANAGHRIGVLTDLLLLHNSRYEFFGTKKVQAWWQARHDFDQRCLFWLHRNGQPVTSWCKHRSAYYIPSLPPPGQLALIARQMRDPSSDLAFDHQAT